MDRFLRNESQAWRPSLIDPLQYYRFEKQGPATANAVEDISVDTGLVLHLDAETGLCTTEALVIEDDFFEPMQQSELELPCTGTT